MADIFISYSKHDPKHTTALAVDLEARGYSVWWDTSLLPGDEFPEEIRRQIDEAKAVILIWTPNSVKSKWVRAEAARADDQGKLITVHAPGLDFRDIPMPFNTRHCEPVTDRTKLYRTLVARGVFPHEEYEDEDVALLATRGDDYYYGRNGFSQDEELAIDYYSRAGAKHYAKIIPSCIWLSSRERAVGNDVEAVQLYREGVDMGNPVAMCKLAIMHKEGRAVVRDDAEAVLLYKMASDLGDPTAVMELGFMYDQGRGVAQNSAEAQRLYRKAGHMGEETAINNLGVMHLESRGVAPSDAEAICLFHKAADMGDVTAYYNLALMYENGRGVEQSKEGARKWYQKAADLGNEEAKEALKHFQPTLSLSAN